MICDINLVLHLLKAFQKKKKEAILLDCKSENFECDTIIGWFFIHHHHSFKPLTNFAKSCISDVWQGSEYASDHFSSNMQHSVIRLFAASKAALMSLKGFHSFDFINMYS